MADAAAKSGGAGAEVPAEPEELTVFVQNLLQQMQIRFQAMSDAIIGKIDEMGGRIDDLERNISELMTQASASAGAAPGGAAAGAPAARQ